MSPTLFHRLAAPNGDTSTAIAIATAAWINLIFHNFNCLV